VLDDFRALDESPRILVKQAIAWVKKNPLSDTEEAMVNGWAAKAAVSRLDF